MISLKFKSSIALLLTGLVAGFCLSFLFNGCGNDPAVTHETVTPTKDLKKEADVKEASYQAKITELENKNQQLKLELQSAKGQLVKMKSKSEQRETKIKAMIEPNGYTAKELLRKVKPALVSATSLSLCDSLVQEVNEYMQENSMKDSLYEVQIGKQDSLIAGKDSIIENKTKLHQNLQTLFEQSLTQQEILSKENTQLRRKFKRQKFRSKLVTLGVTVLSGLAANYLIQH